MKPTTLDTLNGHALRAAQLADRLGCGHSTQGGGMPSRAEVDSSLVKDAARVVGLGGMARTKALESLAGEVLFALILDPGEVDEVPLPAPAPRSAAPILRHLDNARLATLRNELDAEQARRAPPGEVVAYQVRREIPPGGALIHVELPGDNLITADWFPTVEIAKVALAGFAVDLGREVHPDGVSIAMVEPDRAWIEDRSSTTATTGEKR